MLIFLMIFSDVFLKVGMGVLSDFSLSSKIGSDLRKILDLIKSEVVSTINHKRTCRFCVIFHLRPSFCSLVEI